MSGLDLPIRDSPQKKISQRNRVVMEFVVSREHESDRTLSCQGP